MKNKFVLVFLLVALESILFAGEISPLPKTFDPKRNPQKDLQTAIVLARQSGKKIILDVGGNWCIWCKRLDQFIESHSELKNFIDTHYVWVKINYSKENKNTPFLKQFPKIPGYPHLFVLNSDGTLLHSQNTGLLEKGKSYNKTKFLTFLRKWAGKE